MDEILDISDSSFEGNYDGLVVAVHTKEYVLVDCLSERGGNEVWRAYERTGIDAKTSIDSEAVRLQQLPEHLRILKCFAPSEQGERAYQRELSLLKAIAFEHCRYLPRYESAPEANSLTYPILRNDGSQVLQRYPNKAMIAFFYLPGQDFRQAFGPSGASFQIRLARLRQLIKPLKQTFAELDKLSLIHGDISPKNLLLDPEGQVHLIDLGLAAFSHENPCRSLGEGTYAYRSPEIANRSDALTPATDQYALAVVTYYVLSGQHPRQEGEALRQHLSSGLNTEGAHPQLIAVYQRALNQDPAERFASTPAFLGALDEAIATHQQHMGRQGEYRQVRSEWQTALNKRQQAENNHPLSSALASLNAIQARLTQYAKHRHLSAEQHGRYHRLAEQAQKLSAYQRQLTEQQQQITTALSQLDRTLAQAQASPDTSLPALNSLLSGPAPKFKLSELEAQHQAADTALRDALALEAEVQAQITEQLRHQRTQLDTALSSLERAHRDRQDQLRPLTELSRCYSQELRSRTSDGQQGVLKSLQAYLSAAERQQSQALNALNPVLAPLSDRLSSLNELEGSFEVKRTKPERLGIYLNTLKQEGEALNTVVKALTEHTALISHSTQEPEAQRVYWEGCWKAQKPKRLLWALACVALVTIGYAFYTLDIGPKTTFTVQANNLFANRAGSVDVHSSAPLETQLALYLNGQPCAEKALPAGTPERTVAHQSRFTCTPNKAGRLSYRLTEPTGTLIQSGSLQVDLPRLAVMLTTDPNTSQIMVDGQPYDGLGLTQGAHELRLSHAGYHPQQHRLNVSGGERYHYTLMPLSYTLNLNLTPSDTEVTINGEPYTGQALNAGEYSLGLSKAGYESQTHSLTLNHEQPGLREHTEYRASYELARAYHPFTLDVTPADTAILVDGAPYTGAPLTEGTHTLSLSRAGYQSQEHKLDLRQAKHLSYQLSPNTRTLTLSGQPEGATMTLYRQGESQAVKALKRGSQALAPGAYSVLVSKAGYESQRYAVDLTTDQTLRYGLTVSKPTCKPGNRGPWGLDRLCTLEGVEFTMKPIPANTFWMGAKPGEGEEDEYDRHLVSVKGFYMMETEVTWALYDRCVAAKACDNNEDIGGAEGWGKGRRPVINVSWSQVKEQFIPWLNRQLNLADKSAHAFRLPSESEWEYAARAGSETKYSWGDEIRCDQAKFGYRNNKQCGSARGTAPVKTYVANGFGLYDMSGNVWEWVEDCWHDSYKGAPDDGSAWGKENGGVCGHRVLRGGSWVNFSVHLRLATRYWNTPSHRGATFGFRLVQGL